MRATREDVKEMIRRANELEGIETFDFIAEMKDGSLNSMIILDRHLRNARRTVYRFLYREINREKFFAPREILEGIHNYNMEMVMDALKFLERDEDVIKEKRQGCNSCGDNEPCLCLDYPDEFLYKINK